MSKHTSEKGKNAGIAARIREAGVRARAEAEARRRADKPASTPREIGGTGGLEPTRYGDWERKGVVSDF
jgi:hypothetical protein